MVLPVWEMNFVFPKINFFYMAFYSDFAKGKNSPVNISKIQMSQPYVFKGFYPFRTSVLSNKVSFLFFTKYTCVNISSIKNTDVLGGEGDYTVSSLLLFFVYVMLSSPSTNPAPHAREPQSQVSYRYKFTIISIQTLVIYTTDCRN